VLAANATQSEPQALLGERFLEKPKWPYSFGAATGLRICIRGDENAGDPEATMDFFRGIDAVARSQQPNVHEHHVGPLPFGNRNGLIGGHGDGMALCGSTMAQC
jgi:hypothetical protein